MSIEEIDYKKILSDIYFECSDGVFYRPEIEDHNKFIQFVKDGHYHIKELKEEIDHIEVEHREEINSIEDEHSKLIKEYNKTETENKKQIDELYDKIEYLNTIVDFFIGKHSEFLPEMKNKELLESFKKYFEDKKKEDDD